MKRIVAVLMALMLTVAFCGCQEKPSTESETQGTESGGQSVVNRDGGTHILDNNDGAVKFAVFADSHIGQSEKHTKTVEKAIAEVNKIGDLDFTLFLGDNIDNGYYYSGEDISAGQLSLFYEAAARLNKPYYVISGNHDANTTKFEKDMIIECGDVAIIGFFANYYTFDPDKIYDSNGKVSAGMLMWLEKAFEQCKGKRIILACHYSIAEEDGEKFSAPIPPAQPVPQRDEEMVDFGREKILELAEKYNAELYFNGHEHKADMPTGTAGVLTNFNIGSVGNQGLYAIVTVDKSKATIELKDTDCDGNTVKAVEYIFKNKK